LPLAENALKASAMRAARVAICNGRVVDVIPCSLF
jgi:hypothetical protein